MASSIAGADEETSAWTPFSDQRDERFNLFSFTLRLHPDTQRLRGSDTTSHPSPPPSSSTSPASSRVSSPALGSDDEGLPEEAFPEEEKLDQPFRIYLHDGFRPDPSRPLVVHAFSPRFAHVGDREGYATRFPMAASSHPFYICDSLGVIELFPRQQQSQISRFVLEPSAALIHHCRNAVSALNQHLLGLLQSLGYLDFFFVGVVLLAVAAICQFRRSQGPVLSAVPTGHLESIRSVRYEPVTLFDDLSKHLETWLDARDDYFDALQSLTPYIDKPISDPALLDSFMENAGRTIRPLQMKMMFDWNLDVYNDVISLLASFGNVWRQLHHGFLYVNVHHAREAVVDLIEVVRRLNDPFLGTGNHAVPAAPGSDLKETNTSADTRIADPYAPGSRPHFNEPEAGANPPHGRFPTFHNLTTSRFLDEFSQVLNGRGNSLSSGSMTCKWMQKDIDAPGALLATLNKLRERAFEFKKRNLFQYYVRKLLPTKSKTGLSTAIGNLEAIIAGFEVLVPFVDQFAERMCQSVFYFDRLNDSIGALAEAPIPFARGCGHLPGLKGHSCWTTDPWWYSTAWAREKHHLVTAGGPDNPMTSAIDLTLFYFPHSEDTVNNLTARFVAMLEKHGTWDRLS